MPETLTDAQKVLRNDTGIRMAAALEALASEVVPSTVIAPEYDATQTYAVGDLVMYRGVLYRCTTAITTPEDWTAAHWTATMVSDEYRPASAQDVIDAAQDAAIAAKYTKPSDGIPKSDLATAVKTSLENADTALKAVVRPNLLYNWYFIGGGSQRGTGVFPINQRGQGNYSDASSYCIDGWFLNGYPPTVTLSEDGLTINKTSGSTSGFMTQIIDIPYAELAGRQVTMSVLYDDGKLATGTSIFPDELPSETTDVISLSSQIPHGGTYSALRITDSGQVRAGVGQTSGNSLKFKAVKVELGDTQTLAHEENGAWILNEIPDWGEELRKCQAYLQWIPVPIGSGYAASVGSGICWLSTEARIAVPLAFPMAATPSVELVNANASIYIAGNTTSITPTAISAGSSAYSNANYRNILNLRCTIEGGTAKSLATLVLVGTANPGGIMLSCEPS